MNLLTIKSTPKGENTIKSLITIEQWQQYLESQEASVTVKGLILDRDPTADEMAVLWVILMGAKLASAMHISVVDIQNDK